MTYTVIWLTSAEEQLKSLWRDADDAGEILAAARRMDAKLIRDAHKAGESRDSDDDRIMFDLPLGIRFWVSRLDQIAAVVSVWRTA